MDVQVTKLELIEMLLRTDEVSVLEKIRTLLLENYESHNLESLNYDMIDKRRRAHLNEESASYSWEEVKEKVRVAKL